VGRKHQLAGHEAVILLVNTQINKGKIGKIPEHLGLSRQLLMVGLSTWQNLMFDVPKKNIVGFAKKKDIV